MKKLFLGVMLIWFLMETVWFYEILISLICLVITVDFLDKKPKIRQKIFRFIRNLDSKLSKKDKEQ